MNLRHRGGNTCQKTTFESGVRRIKDEQGLWREANQQSREQGTKKLPGSRTCAERDISGAQHSAPSLALVPRTKSHQTPLQPNHALQPATIDFNSNCRSDYHKKFQQMSQCAIEPLDPLHGRHDNITIDEVKADSTANLRKTMKATKLLWTVFIRPWHYRMRSMRPVEL